MNKESSSDGVSFSKRSGFLVLLVVLIVVLAGLFHESFLPNKILYCNDGPLGAISSQSVANTFDTFGSIWSDLNWLGNEGIRRDPSISVLLGFLLTPYGYARYAAPIGLLLLGLSAWFFFRQLRLAPIACVVGGIAAALNSDFFSTAAWGVVAQALCVAANYLALAAVARITDRYPCRSWARVVLAGLAVGMGVMQGWDVGALFSLFVAAFVLYQALFMNESPSGFAQNAGRGVARVVVVALFATILATTTLTSLIGTQITGVVGMAQDEQTREAQWQMKTEWSLPKKEVLQIAVPGVFGYRNSWHMYDDHQPADDQYWGLIGYDGVGQLWRLSGTGLYAGVFVLLLSFWAIAQSLRKGGSPYSTLERRAIWFWTGVLVVTTLLSFGKYLPAFYRLFYNLPYASTIRNPTKFMHLFSWALMIVFAYGLHGLYVAYMQNPVKRAAGFFGQLKSWWKSAAGFEQFWLAGLIFSIGLSAMAWVVYSGKMDQLAAYMQTVGISAEDAPGMAHFSLAAVAWFILFLVLSVVLLVFIFTGQFSGTRAKWGYVLIASLVLVDLTRANAPWIVYWDTTYEYADDPIIKLLANKPYEQRVGMLPGDPKNQYANILYAMYGTSWKQHLFWYYNIECMDIVQEPRVGQDKNDFTAALNTNPYRLWELTGTRYLLSDAGAVNFLNMEPGIQRKELFAGESNTFKQLDLQLGPQKPWFKIARFPDGSPATFTLNTKPGAPEHATHPVDFTTIPTSNGPLAVVEFTPAMPRASLIPSWQVNTNEMETLSALVDPAFNPRQTVMVTDPLPASPGSTANAGTGTVSITDYTPKRITLSADVKSPAVLLMLDRYNPGWEVTVDGKPDHVLRCNYVERGVYLPAGKHEVVFHFKGSYTQFCVSLGASILGLLICGWLAATKDSEPEAPAPISASTAKAEAAAESPKKKSKKA